ncbi:uncharacterized protein PAC_06827 [Phialocephala subalpina]|uniref:Gfd2/YDR514C-like C-terminal domain-containing protein n=1 Tax=Phialocephala subalpina TaxID=576137 RepID=A0A1L7WVY5_9HELO|nr:uncharacterized protein PAC_06827 [Phialocephala subalpina]
MPGRTACMAPQFSPPQLLSSTLSSESSNLSINQYTYFQDELAAADVPTITQSPQRVITRGFTYQDRFNILGCNLPDSDIKDLLIVGLDVENPHVAQIAKNGQFQVGLSILDTRHLQSSMRKRTGSQGLLQTHQFCIGSPKYFKNASRTFCFGQSKHIKLEDLNTTIQNLISNRDFILVVHGGLGDAVFLEAAKVELNPLYILDTQKAAQHPLDLDHRCTIEEMLNLLECSFGHRVLHVAGNDANFTLRALLLIAAVDTAAANHLDPAHKCLVSAFEEIARESVPLNDRQIEREARTKIVEDKARRRREKRERREACRLEENTNTERGKTTDSEAPTLESS